MRSAGGPDTGMGHVMSKKHEVPHEKEAKQASEECAQPKEQDQFPFTQALVAKRVGFSERDGDRQLWHKLLTFCYFQRGYNMVGETLTTASAMGLPEEAGSQAEDTKEEVIRQHKGSEGPEDLDQLGGFHLDRYRRTGQLEDLEESIKHFSSALALTPE
ncbi:unnamed protein product, partial [Rhizoctonia solani]